MRSQLNFSNGPGLVLHWLRQDWKGKIFSSSWVLECFFFLFCFVLFCSWENVLFTFCVECYCAFVICACSKTFKQPFTDVLNSLEIWAVKVPFLIYEHMFRSIVTARSECTTKHKNKASYYTDPWFDWLFWRWLKSDQNADWKKKYLYIYICKKYC